jgi:hypothetical protein
MPQQVTRRAALKYGAIGSAACALNLATPARSDAYFDSFIPIAKEVAVAAFKFFISVVAVRFAGKAASKLSDYIDMNVDQVYERFVPATKNLYEGEGARYHWDTGDKMWLPSDLQVPTKKLAGYGMDLGLNLVQWQINNSIFEHAAMAARNFLCLPPAYRKPKISNDLQTELADANELYTQRGDIPYTANEVLYNVPLVDEKGKDYTAFAVKRAKDPEFLYVPSRD